MATIRHRKEWNADSEGRYSRQVGWKYNSAGELVQHKFYLGTDLAEARSRNQRLEELWSHIAHQSTLQPVWDEQTLFMAKELVLCHSCFDLWYPLGNRSWKTDFPGRLSWRSVIG